MNSAATNPSTSTSATTRHTLIAKDSRGMCCTTHEALGEHYGVTYETLGAAQEAAADAQGDLTDADVTGQYDDVTISVIEAP